MNQKQVEYAINRINGILESKIAAVRLKHAGTCLSPAERRELVVSGKVKLKKPIPAEAFHRTYGDGADLFDWGKYASVPTNQAAIDKESAVLTATATKIKDQLMLGEASEALVMIEKFAKG